MQLCTQGLGNTRASIKPLEYRLGLNAEFSAPLRHRLGFAIKCKQSVTALVVSLLNAIRPVAIARFVRAVVIPSFYRMLWARPLPHFSQEALEVAPLIADTDPATAIENELTGIRIPASIMHFLPAPIRNRFAHAMGRMLPNSGTVSTSMTPSFGKRMLSNLCFPSTNTSAKPITRSVWRPSCSLFQYSPGIKHLPFKIKRNISSCWHNVMQYSGDNGTRKQLIVDHLSA